MKVYDNGIYRDATQAEIEDFNRHQKESEEYQLTQGPTQADRIEAQVMYTALMTDTLLEV